MKHIKTIKNPYQPMDFKNITNKNVGDFQNGNIPLCMDLKIYRKSKA
jgi:hypothetical protein